MPDNKDLAAKGSLLAPVIPRSYDAYAETIVPRFLIYARPLFVSAAILGSAYISARDISAGLLSDVFSIITAVLHLLSFLYSMRISLLYIREMYSGGEIFSPRSANSFKSLMLSLIISGVISAGAYAWIIYRHLNGESGTLILCLILFVLFNLWMMKSRADTLSVFMEEYFVSGLFRVRISDVGDVRVASSAVPGLNMNAERRIYFELYDHDGVYFGRDCMYEGDYLHLEKLVKGEVTSNPGLFNTIKKSSQPESGIRRAPKKKKKNPNKKK